MRDVEVIQEVEEQETTKNNMSPDEEEEQISFEWNEGEDFPEDVELNGPPREILKP